MTVDTNDIYAVPVLDKFLIYSPLQRISALVNQSAAKALHDCLVSDRVPPDQVEPLFASLQTTACMHPAPRQGKLRDPLFLGIIPTRACNLNCVYCDFIPSDSAGPPMSLDMAKQAIDAYFHILDQEKHSRADIQFFGGEPFHAPDVVYCSVAYAQKQAGQRGMDVHFEVTTNGMFSQRTARWIADHFNAVILSLDGTADIQEGQRPARNKKPVFPTVYINAKTFSSGPVDLILRLCISQQTAQRIPEITAWMVDEFIPKAVCFETLHPTPQSEAAGLTIPDPVEFARQFHTAALKLESHGIMAVHSTADIHECRLSLCPVGKDALIVSPEGKVDACYLPEHTWKAKGLPFRFGEIKEGRLTIDMLALQGVRAESVNNKPGCRDCLCQYHCAGGCHVRHNGRRNTDRYDKQCLQTRLVTISNLLRQLDQGDLVTSWLSSCVDNAEMRKRSSDRFKDMA